MTRILLVDDQRSLRRSLALMLQNAGYETAEVANGREALAAAAKAHYDLVISDLRMDGMSGIDLLCELKKQHAALPVIVITAFGSIESAVEAMRLGAFDYLTKPFSEADMIEKICASQALYGAKREPFYHDETRANDIVAEAPQMVATLIRAERVARTDISVLISGETGTGKTRLARFIHNKSQRAAHKFVSINCASLPEPLLESELFGHTRGSFTGAIEARAGLFEEAHGGTIFLDEIDTLSPAMQAKLLSVLQDREIRRVGSNKPKSIDIRVVSASNQDLRDLIERGILRSDLYFRINGMRLHLPPLRERPEDLKRLLADFLALYAAKYKRSLPHLTTRALSYVMSYAYPGNVRQLENFSEQMVVFADERDCIDIDALPEDLLQAGPVRSDPEPLPVRPESSSLAESERHIIEAALSRYKHIGDVAKELGIGRTTLWRKLKQYRIHRDPTLRRK